MSTFPRLRFHGAGEKPEKIIALLLQDVRVGNYIGGKLCQKGCLILIFHVGKKLCNKRIGLLTH